MPGSLAFRVLLGHSPPRGTPSLGAIQHVPGDFKKECTLRKPVQKPIARRSPTPGKSAPAKHSPSAPARRPGRPARPGRPLGGPEGDYPLPVDPELGGEIEDELEPNDEAQRADDEAEEFGEMDLDTGSE